MATGALGRGRGRRIAILALLVLLALSLALFGTWRWAMARHPVALLDRIDRVFTGGDARLVAGPVSYGPDPQQRLFVYRPDAGSSTADRTLPVLVFVHGGGWNSGRPRDYAFVARNLAPAGMVVVDAGYRLVPGGEYPAMLEDGAAAVACVKRHAREWGGDPERIVLMGHSAGAYNVAMLALDPQWLARVGLDTRDISGIIGLAGPYDFLPLDSDSTRAAFGAAQDLPATQPVHFARGDAPPMLLATGTDDTTVKPRNTRELARRLAARGGAVDTLEIPGMSHERIIMALSRPFTGDGTVQRAVIAFVRRATARSAAASAPVQRAGG